ncbi:jg14302 [Pararge aegeria aegeria]|uniref:Jg14302 protein n=1 Tax=Pararge aegeria aegeria TaxID=348720 RepID=A0A8S4R7R1_9NEOP|nr:jg14302 [Pararge aegeria aegeria]
MFKSTNREILVLNPELDQGLLGMESSSSSFSGLVSVLGRSETSVVRSATGTAHRWVSPASRAHSRSLAGRPGRQVLQDNLTPEPADMNDDDNFSSHGYAKDAEKLKMMLLAWNYHSQTQGRNGDITESGADSMADLWASYHSALGLGSKPPKTPTPMATGHSSPIHVGSGTPVEPASTHDETSSSDRTKDDDDGGASDDDSDDRVDPQHHDPERLKAFNVRPTPAHLTSVQAEHILAQACENESLNAKRMRLGLDPVSQPMPTVPTPMAIDTTATSAVASSFLSLYSGAMSSSCTSVSSTASTSLASAAHSKAAADTTRPATSPALDNPLLNNNSLKLDNANGSTGSKTASPASSPAPLFRPSFPNTFGNPPTFGRQSSNTNPTSALSSNALLSSLTAIPPTGVGVNAAMAAYQSALLSAMAAHTHTFPNITAPTDLSLKTSVSTPLHATSTSSSLSGTGQKSLLSHKLSGAEVGAVRQLITGYRESAAFLLRSADELEALLLNQP